MVKILSFIITLAIFSVIGAATVTEVEIIKIIVKPKDKRTSSETGKTKTIIETVYTAATGTSNEQHASSTVDSEIYSYTGKYQLNKSFALDIINQHNIKRSLHDAQNLHWNSTVFEYAAQYALDYDCSGVLKHSGGNYGENLAIGYSTEGALDAWYDEGVTYVYGTESTYNHFTALIWNNSNSLGCAYKYCNEVWGTYIICSYYPAGNVIGYSSQNVFPPV